MRINKIKDKKLKIYTVKIHYTIIILYKDFETAREKQEIEFSYTKCTIINLK